MKIRQLSTPEFVHQNQPFVRALATLDQLETEQHSRSDVDDVQVEWVGHTLHEQIAARETARSLQESTPSARQVERFIHVLHDYFIDASGSTQTLKRHFVAPNVRRLGKLAPAMQAVVQIRRLLGGGQRGPGQYARNVSAADVRASRALWKQHRATIVKAIASYRRKRGSDPVIQRVDWWLAIGPSTPDYHLGFDGWVFLAAFYQTGYTHQATGMLAPVNQVVRAALFQRLQEISKKTTELDAETAKYLHKTLKRTLRKSKVLTIILTAADLDKAIAKLQAAGLLSKTAGALEVTIKLGKLATASIQLTLKQSAAFAAKQGMKVAAQKLGDAAKEIAKGAMKPLVILDALRSAIELVRAIRSGNPRRIEDAAVGTAETVVAGIVSVAGAGLVGGLIVGAYFFQVKILAHMARQVFGAIHEIQRRSDIEDAERLAVAGAGLADTADFLAQVHTRLEPQINLPSLTDWEAAEQNVLHTVAKLLLGTVLRRLRDLNTAVQRFPKRTAEHAQVRHTLVSRINRAVGEQRIALPDPWQSSGLLDECRRILYQIQYVVDYYSAISLWQLRLLLAQSQNRVPSPFRRGGLLPTGL